MVTRDEAADILAAIVHASIIRLDAATVALIEAEGAISDKALHASLREACWSGPLRIAVDDYEIARERVGRR